MTSSKLPEGYVICPHCEGAKKVLYEGTFEMPCKLCQGSGIIDWVRNCMKPPLSNREKPMSYLEHKRKVKEFREKMKERIKNDRRKNDFKSRR